MKEFFTRALSGIIYVALILAATFSSKYAFLALIAVLGFLCLNEFLQLLKASKVTYLTLALLMAPLVFYAFQFFFWKSFLLTITLVVNTMLFLGLKGNKKFKKIYESKSKYLSIIFYQILGFTALAFIPFVNEQYEPFLVLGIFILVWVNDSFAYLTGVTFGKTKLCPSISPNKSVEGFIGGSIMALVASYFLYKYVGVISVYHWLGYGVIASVLGSIGDLVQSKFKRMAGVKDSGNLMPGHGGIFDRLDSVLYASPFVFLLLNI